ncbi:MAG: transcriptional repressor LexA [Alphaproteobacteria bacterium]
MLTKKQRELLMYIERRLRESGISPSFDEMKEALDLRSKSGIHRLITGLEERGFIRRLPHRARALEVLRLPETAAVAGRSNGAAASANDFSPKVIAGSFRNRGLGGAASHGDEPAIELPLYGKIAAGTPIEALRDHSSTISMPASILGRGEYYALQVEGDSMVDAGILDEDVVVIKRGEVADSGEIVVALIDDNEVTLKRLRRKGDSIALEPANKKYETRIFGPDRVRIQGKLVSLFRRY